ncbi:hypothetical protein [Larkinella terrae]|uniref:Uncharacterized protein n=1 Tax=Larkinella terrae TaxID=2025311 RepID=A0A7K0EJU1_9BACT|nr:hypothetical protein [Larkinella terrae]MRS62077.1 hypothetical protein [Larkinella terrae]
MKTIMKTCLGLLAIALAIPASAQNKLKNDPTYSTANYKHPNKATAARQWEPEAGIEFRKRKRQPMNIATYREQQRRGGLGDPAITIPATPSMANRNYKQQNLMVNPQPANKPEVATRIEADESVGN